MPAVWAHTSDKPYRTKICKRPVPANQAKGAFLFRFKLDVFFLEKPFSLLECQILQKRTGRLKTIATCVFTLVFVSGAFEIHVCTSSLPLQLIRSLCMLPPDAPPTMSNAIVATVVFSKRNTTPLPKGLYFLYDES